MTCVDRFCKNKGVIAVQAVPVILFLITNLIGQRQDFFDRLLSFDCRNCYYISLDVSSPEYSGPVVIENDDLFLFLNETKALDKSEYAIFLREHLLLGKPLLLKTAKLDKEGIFLTSKGVNEFKFRLPRSNPKTDQVFSQGCVATVSYYFLQKQNDSQVNVQDCLELVKDLKTEDRRIKNHLDVRDEAALVKRLFDWKILVRFEGLTGRILIEGK